MQRIERYGVLALVFLLVTIVTFALWDDGSKGADEVAAADNSRRAPQTQRGEEPERRQMSSTDRLSRIEAQKEAAERRRREQAERARNAAPSVNANASNSLADQFDAARRRGEGAGTSGARNAPKPASPGGFETSSKPTIDTGSQGLRIGEQPAASNAAKPAADPRSGKTASSKTNTSQSVADMDAARRRRTHEVKPGDTLSAIAQRTYGDSESWRAIAAANPGVDPNNLKLGQVLVLPAPREVATSTSSSTSTAAAPSAATKAPTVAPGPGGTYTVQRGDVLSQIAQDRLGSVKRVPDILALNPGLIPEQMQPGQVLAMPAGSSSRVASSAGPAPSSTNASASTAARRDDRPRVR